MTLLRDSINPLMGVVPLESHDTIPAVEASSRPEGQAIPAPPATSAGAGTGGPWGELMMSFEVFFFGG